MLRDSLVAAKLYEGLIPRSLRLVSAFSRAVAVEVGFIEHLTKEMTRSDDAS